MIQLWARFRHTGAKEDSTCLEYRSEVEGICFLSIVCRSLMRGQTGQFRFEAILSGFPCLTTQAPRASFREGILPGFCVGQTVDPSKSGTVFPQMRLQPNKTPRDITECVKLLFGAGIPPFVGFPVGFERSGIF